MKNNLNRTVLLIAAVLALGAAAYGQDSITAKIPFPFRSAGVDLPAGEYSVARLSMGQVLRLRNTDTNKSVLLASGIHAVSNNDSPRLVFKCTGDGCALSQLWFSGSSGWEFKAPRMRDDQLERLATIYASQPKGR